MKNRIQGLIIGFLVAAIVFGASPVLAESIMTMIYVNFDPINIVIDGVDKNPPEDMKPFIYEGRTFVSLRYVAETFGKNVNWIEATRSVIITDPKPQLTEFSDSFVNTPLSNMWNKSGDGAWTFDGNNGLLFSAKFMVNGYLILDDSFFPDHRCNYTLEFDAAGEYSDYDNYLFVVYFGKNGKGEYVNRLYVSYSGRSDGASVGYEDKSIATITNFKINKNEYVHVKIQIKDDQADLYLNTKYITSQKLSNETQTFAFGNRNHDYYIRNFKITID